MRVAIGSDHGGFELKEYLKSELKNDFDFIDEGCFSKDSVDYPLYAEKVSKEVQNKNADYGIVICTNGIGMSIAANKFRGIRCALCLNESMAFNSKTHNNANVLSLGATNQSNIEALKIVKTFLNTEFSNEERHARRVNIINNFEGE